EGARVLDGFSAEISLSGITFVTGKSGAGKSVVCRLAVALLRPDSGEVTLLGTRVDLAPERELIPLRAKVPYLVQGAALLDWLTVRENVALSKAPSARVDESIARVGLTALAGKYPPEIGPGAKKRTAIARALALAPRYLLFDEPTTGLDHEAKGQVNEV